MAAGVYLHIPFCKSRCSYCDFATDIYRDSGAVQRYVDALCKEIGGSHATVRDRAEDPSDTLPHGRVAASTIYFGGGTPSLLAPIQVERIITAVRGCFDISPDAEITMEMNPST